MHIYARGSNETDMVPKYFEIMLPYAGIIRIRSLGMISAPCPEHPCYMLFCHNRPTGHYFFSTSFTS
jgi:hypothetical protein